MKRTLVDIISYLFIMLFVYASVSKLMDIEKFQTQLSKSPMLTSYAWVISWATIISEIIITFLLVLKKSRLLGLYLSFMLMVMFTTYIVIITQYSQYVPCSCGGILENMGWNEHLIFNSIFSILAVLGIMMYPVNQYPITRPNKMIYSG